MHARLASTPDMYLDKLHLELQEVCGVSVSLSTVWGTLIKGGYFIKKVCDWYPCFPIPDSLTA
jgi:hypothetical protein